MDRPQYAINPPKTSNLKVTVPAGWYITIAGVSNIFSCVNVGA